MTTRTQLRARINAAYPFLAKYALDHAIVEVRRIRKVEAEYYDGLNPEENQ